MELPLSVDRADPRPLPVQLAAGFHHLGRLGVLRPGDRLPSARALAGQLGVARNTVTAAYEQLHGEGWVSVRHGAGTYVDAPAPAPVPVADAPAAREPAVNLLPGAALPGGVVPSAWRRALRAAADHPLPQWPTDTADPGFAAVVAGLLRQRGHSAPPGAVLATSGTAAAIAELAQLLPAGSRVGVEDPGWPRVRAILRAAGHTVVPVPVDGEGLKVDALEHLCAVVCTPGHQFPLGGRLGAVRRQQLAAWARDTGAWVVEDDYDGEIRYGAAPLPLLASLAPDRVVHLGSFSKILTPGLGVGWLAGPPQVVAAAARRRRAGGVRPGVLSQRVVAALGQAGDLDRHLRRVRRELAARRQVVLAALGGRAEGAASGSHVVVRLRGPGQEDGVVAALLARGVAVDPLARYRVAAPVAGVAVGYSGPSRADLAPGVAAVAAALP